MYLRPRSRVRYRQRRSCSSSEAEARRDDCYLGTVALGTRTVGREATRAAYAAYFTAFPDLADDEGFAFGEDALVSWGHLRGTSEGEWLGIPPRGGRFEVPFTNVAMFANGQMQGETLYFDLATLCEQGGFEVLEICAAASMRTSRRQDPHATRDQRPSGYRPDAISATYVVDLACAIDSPDRTTREGSNRDTTTRTCRAP